MNKLVKVLESIIANDRSQVYKQGEARPSDGKVAEFGRWATPAEIAKDYLQAIAPHTILIHGKITTEQEARDVFENGGTVVLYWSHEPDSGMAYAAEVISKEFGNLVFGKTALLLADAIFTIPSEGR